MTLISKEMIEELLHIAEGEIVDFKREQYRFYDGTPDGKKKDAAGKVAFLKDVLSLANAERTRDAYIVIGANENPGQRAHIVGISLDDHFDDAELQELIGRKTNRDVKFAYIPATIDSKPVALIRVDQKQQRPIFLKETFQAGDKRFEADHVWVRKGSKNTRLSPDEIVARFGQVRPILKLELGVPSRESIDGTDLKLRCPFLPSESDRDERVAMRQSIRNPVKDLLKPTFADELHQLIERAQNPGPTLDQIARQNEVHKSHAEFGVLIVNEGKLAARDVRIELCIDKTDTFRIVDHLPRLGMLDELVHPQKEARVVERDGDWKISFALGKIQPGAARWSEPLWIFPSENVLIEASAKIFSDEQPMVEVPVCISVEMF